MTETTKPTWVDALASTEDCLRQASEATEPALIDARTRQAYAWLAVAQVYKD